MVLTLARGRILLDVARAGSPARRGLTIKTGGFPPPAAAVSVSLVGYGMGRSHSKEQSPQEQNPISMFYVDMVRLVSETNEKGKSKCKKKLRALLTVLQICSYLMPQL